MASIYVNTYRKYNEGAPGAKHLDPSDYEDRFDFIEACEELHKDEADPELMFQSHEGIPAAFIAESSVNEELWEFLELDEAAQGLVEAYLESVDSKGTVDDALEACMGTYIDEEDWAANYLEDCGMLAELPKWAAPYINFEAYARDAQMGGDVTFVRRGGKTLVFRG